MVRAHRLTVALSWAQGLLGGVIRAYLWRDRRASVDIAVEEVGKAFKDDCPDFTPTQMHALLRGDPPRSAWDQLSEDKRKYRNLNWYTDSKKFEAAAGKPQATCSVVLKMDTEADPTFLGFVETGKRGDVVIDTPRFVGYSILEVSRLIMLNAHYKYYKAVYGARCRLLFTDTDSLAYEIRTENIVVDMVASGRHRSGVGVAF